MNNKIAFCGMHGVPANYGGFETAVDVILRRIVSTGYPMEVFCHSSHEEPQNAKWRKQKFVVFKNFFQRMEGY